MSKRGLACVTRTFWTPHSADPRGAWRGLEKCSAPRGDAGTGPLLFDDRLACEGYIRSIKMEQFFRPIPIQLVCPAVGQDLNDWLVQLRNQNA